MNRPEMNRLVPDHGGFVVPHTFCDLARDLSRQKHFEAEVSDFPCDQIAGVLDLHGLKAVHLKAGAFAADEGGRASIAEQEK